MNTMKLKHFCVVLAAAMGLGISQVYSQHSKCASMDIWQQRAQRDPAVLERMAQSEAATQAWIANHQNTDETAALVTIPVVVHVVYNTTNQNVSDAQVESQIVALNEDYRLRNADSVPLGHPFWPHTADTEIEFCLASVDPSGNATNGITRTNTSVTVFDNSNMDNVKFSAFGGHDNWDPTRYLNIWVCRLGGGLYGYATFPSDLASDPDYDGVVIDFRAFGYIGTAQPPADLGRTGTHEVGHWLNLRHIWGDATCGSDLVSDTRIAEEANYGCPGFPHNAFSQCGSDVNGEMYMNYMDYVDDSCMVMFTFGQKNRMRAALDGDRIALQSSPGCGAVAAVKDDLSAGSVDLSPNPTPGVFTLQAHPFNPRTTQVVVTNALGAEVYRHENARFPLTIDLSTLPNDLYFVRVSNGRSLVTRKVVIAH
jgi:hypothetical protein